MWNYHGYVKLPEGISHGLSSTSRVQIVQATAWTTSSSPAPATARHSPPPTWHDPTGPDGIPAVTAGSCRKNTEKMDGQRETNGHMLQKLWKHMGFRVSLDL